MQCYLHVSRGSLLASCVPYAWHMLRHRHKSGFICQALELFTQPCTAIDWPLHIIQFDVFRHSSIVLAMLLDQRRCKSACCIMYSRVKIKDALTHSNYFRLLSYCSASAVLFQYRLTRFRVDTQMVFSMLLCHASVVCFQYIPLISFTHRSSLAISAKFSQVLAINGDT
jgi:hypothetical protein